MVKSVRASLACRASITRRADGSREGGCSGVSLFTAGLTLITLLRQYSLYAPSRNSVHTTRLLNSAQAWIDHGIWKSGRISSISRGIREVKIS